MSWRTNPYGRTSYSAPGLNLALASRDALCITLLADILRVSITSYHYFIVFHDVSSFRRSAEKLQYFWLIEESSIILSFANIIFCSQSAVWFSSILAINQHFYRSEECYWQWEYALGVSWKLAILSCRMLSFGIIHSGILVVTMPSDASSDSFGEPHYQ